jgi:HK97 family phage portal protein
MNILKRILFGLNAFYRASSWAGLHPSDPAMVNWFGGGRKTSSGEFVTEDTALTLPAYYACLRNIAEDVGKLPVVVYEEMPDGSKRRDKTHPVWRLMQVEANPEMSGKTLRETMIHHALGWGNGFAEIVRDGAGNPVQLWPITPDRVAIKRDERGRLYYEVTQRGGKKVAMSPADVLHIHGLSFDGVVGYSLAQYMRESIGYGLAMDRHNATFYANGAIPGAVLEHPATMSAPAAKRLRESWEQVHGGAANAHKVAILEEGMKLSTIAIPNRDAQLVESKVLTIQDMCRITRMIPHMIAENSAATFSNIEHQGIEYVQYTVDPWAGRIEGEGTRKLFKPSEQGRWGMAHNFNALLRGDIKSRAEAHNLSLQNGVSSINDVLKLEDRDPVEGGDRRFVPLNMIPLDRVDEYIDAQIKIKANGTGGPTTPPGDQPAAVNGQRSLEPFRAPLTDVLGRMLRKEAAAARNAAKKPEKFLAWLEEFYTDHRALMLSAIEPALTTWNAVADAPLDAATLVDEHCERSKAALLEASGAKRSEFADAIEAVVKDWETQRAASAAITLTRDAKWKSEPGLIAA